MPIWVVGGIAAVAGILLGYWLRSTSAKAQSAAFEALAGEREKTAAALREELQRKSESERNLAASVSGLEAELRNERQNLKEKVELLESAKKRSPISSRLSPVKFSIKNRRPSPNRAKRN